MRYFAAGCVVAYTNHRGEVVAVADCLSPEIAAKEATRRNFLETARESARAQRMREIPTPKKSVRYFEPDAFA